MEKKNEGKRKKKDVLTVEVDCVFLDFNVVTLAVSFLNLAFMIS